jgi:DNA-binding IscR family transcriptional regulator
VTLADVIEAVDTSLTERPWMRHGRSDDSPTRQSVQQVWLTLRANAQQVLESTTIADIVGGEQVPEPAVPDGPPS